MVRHRVNIQWAATALTLVAGVSAGVLVGYASAGFASGADTSAVLDGTRELQPDPLADLAHERAEMGAAWLADVSQEDGAFIYLYYPEADEYDFEDYNEVRHAGTTYSLFQAYGMVGGDRILEAAEGGARYIEEHSEPAMGAGRAFLYEGRMKLGGQALALVALLERRRVVEDTTYDQLIFDLADFMLSLELEDQPGRYFQSYYADPGEPTLEPDSDYYPGEALLAMTRLAQQFPDGPYLEYAARAADFLIHERDGDIPAAGQVPREDHWLAMALSELYRLQPEPEYREVAYLQAESMVNNQHTSAEWPMRIGASAARSPINYTSTATKGEALVAVWAMAEFADDEERVERYSTAARRNVQFQMRVQYTADNSQLYPRPVAVIGAWGKDALDPWIRMDFVQHNVSALIGVWYLTTEGDIPIGAPIN